MKWITCRHWLPGLLLGLLLVGPARAQMYNADSLRAELRQPDLPDTSRVLSSMCLMMTLNETSYDEAIKVGLEALRLARRINYDFGQYLLHRQLGVAYRDKGDKVRALRYLSIALKMPDTTSHLRQLRLAMLADIVTLNIEESNFETAVTQLRELEKAFAIEPTISPVRQRAVMNQYWGRLFIQWSEAGTAPDSALPAALRYGRQELRYARKEGQPEVISSAFDTMGQVMTLLHKPDSASYYFEQQLSMARRGQSDQILVESLGKLANSYGAQRRWADMLPVLREARMLAIKSGDTPSEVSSYGQEATALAKLGRWQEAYQAATRHKELTDSISTQEKRASFAQLSTKFEAERKESRIRELTQQQQVQQARLWGVVGGAALLGLGLAVAGWLALRLRRSQATLEARNQQLDTARVTQDRLYSVIGHDLRTPLTALEGLATLIDYYYQPQHQDPVAMQEVTAEVRETTSQLSELLDNLLYWAGSQSGELAYRPEALHATALLREAVDLYAPAAHARQVALTIVEPAPAGLPALWADRNMVRTQLRNLLGNALKVAPADSTIALAATADHHQVVLSVHDEGPGLSAAQLEQLNKADKPADRRQRLPEQWGTGLGLPLVRQLADRQHAAFTLTSQPGQGTTASIALPLATAQLAASPA